MKRFILLSLITILFAGCENDIPYRLDDIKPELILNSLISTSQEINYIHLNYTGKATVGEVTDGVVEITVNGELKETPTSEINRDSYIPQRRFPVKTRFQPGDVVRIDARAGGDKYHAWAEVTVPSIPNMIKVDTFPTVYKDPYSTGGKQLKYKITLQDSPGKNNFYRIVLDHKYAYTGKIEENEKDTVLTFSLLNLWPWEDVVLTDGKPATTEELDNELIERVRNVHGIFDNKRFAGGEYTLTVSNTYGYWDSYYYHDYTFIPESLDISTTVRLMSITKEEYYYLNVLNYIGSDVMDEYLTDPVKIPTNVHGGTGFVGISTETTCQFEILKDIKFIYM